MKLATPTRKINPKNALKVGCDIGKSRIHYYSELDEYRHQVLQGDVANTTSGIDAMLESLQQQAQDAGFEGLWIVCEPTGGYEKKLMRRSRKQGCLTSYVSGESVHKMKVVESNDTGKSDHKDPRVILLLARLGKVLTYRELRGEYLLLRELNARYDREEKARVQVRCHIHRVLVRLFCDYGRKNDWLYSPGGRALVERYGANPYRIVRSGYSRFCRVMRNESPGLKESTLRRLFAEAQSSVLHQQDPRHLQLLEEELRDLFQEHELHRSRQKRIREEMEALYWQLWNRGELVPQTQRGVFTAFRIAKILGETGPLADFKHWRQLLRLSGLNLRERRSGQYQGQVRASKKGRPQLRHAIGQAVFGQVKRDRLFGDYYHSKLARGMTGQKAMGAVMRKYLRMFYVLGINRAAFDEQRVFTCASQYGKAA